jgi:hypothetical protein
MTTMTLDSQASRLRRTHGEVIRKSRLAAFWPLTSLGIVLGYLVYAWIAFDVSGVFGAADWNRGVLLSRDSFHHKYQVSYSARQDEVSVTVEGDRNTEQDPLPSWVTTDGDSYRVSLGGRHIVTFATGRLDYTAPDGSTYAARVTKDGVHVKITNTVMSLRNSPEMQTRLIWPKWLNAAYCRKSRPLRRRSLNMHPTFIRQCALPARRFLFNAISLVGNISGLARTRNCMV